MKTIFQTMQRVTGISCVLAGGCLATLPALAQNTANRNNQTRSAVIQLPPGVDNVVSIDALNTILAETSDPDTGDNEQIIPFSIQHVYSGGIARVLGGTSIPTEQFVSPAFSNGNNGFGRSNTGVVSNGGRFGGQTYGQGYNGGNNAFLSGTGGNAFNSNNGIGNFNSANNYGVTGSGLYNIVPPASQRALNSVTGLLDRPVPQVEVGSY